MDNRREIDGLRALAVLPVILFHAGSQTFSGGFVGVDIFFVISGYLITSIILAEMEAGTFTLANFYERRARRILPALFVLMALCLPFAWLWLTPQDMKSFSQSLVAVSTFASNIFFWRTSDYFDTAAELNPLLHTWSLAVEEQYYLLLPLFVLLTWRFGKTWILKSLVVVFIISLASAHWGATNKPIFTFFLLPTRGWELLIGGFIAFYFSLGHKQLSQKWLNELGSLIGVVLIAYSIFSFDSKTPFPSLYTLVPTFGAALIIFFTTPQTSIGKLLGSKIFVGVGLISYSAYLYHQPLFAFAKLRSIDEPSSLLIGVLVAATFCLAYFSWKYVEAPFRNKQRINRKQLFTFCILASFSFILIGLVGHLNKGFQSRLNPSELQILSYGESPYTDTMYKETYRMGVCFLEPEQDSKTFSETCKSAPSNNSVLIWGDSHAAALFYGLKQVFPNISQYNASGCPPIKDAIVSWRPKCKEINDLILKKLNELSPSKIFLHANWSLYDEQNPSVNLYKTIEYIKKILPTTEIMVVGPVPHWNPSLPMFLLSKNVRLDKEHIFFNNSIKKLRLIDKSLRMEALNQSVLYLSPINALCSAENCLATVDYKNEIIPIASDYGHLTEAGSVFLTRILLKE